MCPETHWPHLARSTSFSPPLAVLCGHGWAPLSRLPRDPEQSCCPRPALCWVLLGGSLWPGSQEGHSFSRVHSPQKACEGETSSF